MKGLRERKGYPIQFMLVCWELGNVFLVFSFCLDAVSNLVLFIIFVVGNEQFLGMASCEMLFDTVSVIYLFFF